MMEQDGLRMGQYVLKHPILHEKEEYKKKYISPLNYFVNKYSSDDVYSQKLLELYKKKILRMPEKFEYSDDELKKIAKGVMAWKFKKFKFFSYRYCLLSDVIFLCAFDDEEKAKLIFDEILEIYSKRYWKKLNLLFGYLMYDTNQNVQWEQIEYIRELISTNRRFLGKTTKKILVTANMSAGKSTLLNALVGKKINKTQNDSCTAKVHYIFNKAFEDTLSCEYDHDFELDASLEVLMVDNTSNKSTAISVGTYFRTVSSIENSICFIDTPGVNSSQEQEHMLISRNAITAKDYDMMVYVMNAGTIGTVDERRHLEFVFENYKEKVIFVVNKLDTFRTKDDSIGDAINGIIKELQEIGFENPMVCPISAYAAYLAKMDMFDENLNEDERDEKEHLYRRLGREEYQFNKYYPERYQQISVSDDKNEQLLLFSGILPLEKILYEEK